MTIEQFLLGFFGASVIEIVAAVSGFICVYLIIKRNIWCWFFGLIQVSLYSWFFYQNKLYSDAGLHVIYIGLQFYGWWNWAQNQQADTQHLVIHKTTQKEFTLWLALALLGAFALGYIMSNYTDASFAYGDAFTTCASLIAQWLLTRRHLLNWVFWIIVDIVAIYIYLQKGLYPTTVLYITLLIMCFFGQYSWWKQYQKNRFENT